MLKKKRYWITKDINGIVNVWTKKPGGKDLFFGNPNTLVRDKDIEREYADVPLGFIESIIVTEWIGPSTIWMSRDMDGRIDLWGAEPNWDRGEWFRFWDRGEWFNINLSAYNNNTKYFDFLGISKPAKGELFEITIENGTRFVEE